MSHDYSRLRTKTRFSDLYGKKKQNAAFNSLRILEDFYYQAGVRQDLIKVCSFQFLNDLEQLYSTLKKYQWQKVKILKI